jgi:polyisoprenoid-binding protein YceI
MAAYTTSYTTLISSGLGLAIALAAGGALAQGQADKGSYKIDPVHSQALFTVGHLGMSRLTGRFDSLKGELTVDAGGGTVKAEIEVASVDTNFADRDKHLRSPDFFNAAQFPKMTFESSSVNLPAGGEGTLAGNLTLHGVTRPVVFKLVHVGAGKDPWGGYRSGYQASGVIKRSDYGMKFMLGALSDEVEVRLNIEAIKQ